MSPCFDAIKAEVCSGQYWPIKFWFVPFAILLQQYVLVKFEMTITVIKWFLVHHVLWQHILWKEIWNLEVYYTVQNKNNSFKFWTCNITLKIDWSRYKTGTPKKRSMSLDNSLLQMGNTCSLLQMGNTCNKLSHLFYYQLYGEHFSRQIFIFWLFILKWEWIIMVVTNVTFCPSKKVTIIAWKNTTSWISFQLIWLC